MTLVYKVKSALSLTFKCPPFSSHSLELWQLDNKVTQLSSLSCPTSSANESHFGLLRSLVLLVASDSHQRTCR
jgi:hypothetical protein